MSVLLWLSLTSIHGVVSVHIFVCYVLQPCDIKRGIHWGASAVDSSLYSSRHHGLFSAFLSSKI